MSSLLPAQLQGPYSHNILCVESLQIVSQYLKQVLTMNCFLLFPLTPALPNS